MSHNFFFERDQVLVLWKTIKTDFYERKAFVMFFLNVLGIPHSYISGKVAVALHLYFGDCDS